MSWQLSSAALVLLSLAFAFWWYERSNPPAKLIALVATLAAVAALGRDAFVAVPDVKPITAIVLVGGVAFGAGPGFAIGATAGLMSNMLLGQGPWTPWQMLGWGLVGMIGGGLGAFQRRLGPVTLALACAFSAEVFNLIVDLFTWTGGASHTLEAFWLVLDGAAVFDITHVIASFGFGLAFGPTLLRMLTRARARLQVDWRPSEPHGAPAPSVLAGLLVAATALGLAQVGRPVRAQAQPATNARATQASSRYSREIAYLEGAQNPDGGFGASTGQSSSELYTGWSAIGLAAAGQHPLDVRRDGHSPLRALEREASSLQGAGDIERTMLALYACGVPVDSIAGRDLLGELLHFKEHDGSFAGQVNLTAFAIFALRAAGRSAGDPSVRAAGRWISGQQDSDGGFNFATGGGSSDVDDTAAALQGLIDAGITKGPVVSRALRYLTAAQNLDGGFAMQRGEESNAQSTAWAIQGLIAAGRNPAKMRRNGSRTPIGYLQSLVAPNGSVRYSRTSSQSPVWVTAQALTALAGRPLPIAPPSKARPASIAKAVTATPAPHPAAPRRRRAPTVIPAVVPRTQTQKTTAVELRLQVLARSAGVLAGMLLGPILH